MATSDGGGSHISTEVPVEISALCDRLGLAELETLETSLEVLQQTIKEPATFSESSGQNNFYIPESLLEGCLWLASIAGPGLTRLTDDDAERGRNLSPRLAEAIEHLTTSVREGISDSSTTVGDAKTVLGYIDLKRVSTAGPQNFPNLAVSLGASQERLRSTAASLPTGMFLKKLLALHNAEAQAVIIDAARWTTHHSPEKPTGISDSTVVLDMGGYVSSEEYPRFHRPYEAIERSHMAIDSLNADAAPIRQEGRQLSRDIARGARNLANALIKQLAVEYWTGHELNRESLEAALKDQLIDDTSAIFNALVIEDFVASRAASSLEIANVLHLERAPRGQLEQLTATPLADALQSTQTEQPQSPESVVHTEAEPPTFSEAFAENIAFLRRVVVGASKIPLNGSIENSKRLGRALHSVGFDRTDAGMVIVALAGRIGEFINSLHAFKTREETDPELAIFSVQQPDVFHNLRRYDPRQLLPKLRTMAGNVRQRERLCQALGGEAPLNKVLTELSALEEEAGQPQR